MNSIKRKFTIPDYITAMRIIGTMFLLFIEPFTMVFYILYTFCGITDVLDGWIARKTNTTSEFGAKLDSAADLLFYFVMLMKILNVLWEQLPREIWYVVGVILVIRIISYGVVAIKYHKFSSLHTYMNKMTGAGIFAVPYSVLMSCTVKMCTVVCVIALTASVEELVLHLCGTGHQSDVKSIWHLRSAARKKNT